MEKYKPKAYGERQITIYDYIWNGTVSHVDKELQKAGGAPITIKINSWGGDVFAGCGVVNLIKDYEGEVTTKVMGMAASAAALIFMSGEKRIMPKYSMLMFHKAWNFMAGNADELRKAAKTLDEIDAMIIHQLETKAEIKGDVNDFIKEDNYVSCDDAVKMKMAEKAEDDDEDQKQMEEDEDPKNMPPDEELMEGDEDEKPEAEEEDEEKKAEKRQKFIEKEIAAMRQVDVQNTAINNFARRF